MKLGFVTGLVAISLTIAACTSTPAGVRVVNGGNVRYLVA